MAATGCVSQQQRVNSVSHAVAASHFREPFYSCTASDPYCYKARQSLQCVDFSLAKYAGQRLALKMLNWVPASCAPAVIPAPRVDSASSPAIGAA